MNTIINKVKHKLIHKFGLSENAHEERHTLLHILKTLVMVLHGI